MFKSKLTKKKYYKYQVEKIQRGVWDMELRIITIKEIREGIRREFDRISGVVKEIEQRIEAAKKNKDLSEFDTLEKTYKDYKGDQTSMQEQMMGKWSEKAQQYEGGLDQEIIAIEEKIKGGLEFQGLIKRELKKL